MPLLRQLTLHAFMMLGVLLVEAASLQAHLRLHQHRLLLLLVPLLPPLLMLLLLPPLLPPLLLPLLLQQQSPKGASHRCASLRANAQRHPYHPQLLAHPEAAPAAAMAVSSSVATSAAAGE